MLVAQRTEKEEECFKNTFDLFKNTAEARKVYPIARLDTEFPTPTTNPDTVATLTRQKLAEFAYLDGIYEANGCSATVFQDPLHKTLEETTMQCSYTSEVGADDNCNMMKFEHLMAYGHSYVTQQAGSTWVGDQVSPS